MLIVLTCTFYICNNPNYNNVEIIREKGSIDNLKLSITYCDKNNPFENFISYDVRDNGITEITSHNVRSTMGFSNVEAINQYVQKNELTSEEFCANYGFLYMSISNKNKNYYLLQGYNTDYYYWNLFYEENGNYKIVKLSESQINNNESFQMAFKMEFKDDILNIYLDSGLYEINSNFEISVKPWNMNEILSRICEMELRPHNSKIQYINNAIYLLASTEGYKEYYLVKYDMLKNTLETYKTNYCAQEVFEFNNELVILSTKDNKIFFERFISDILNSKEVLQISELNLENFRKNTPLTDIIVDNSNIYLTMSNSDELNSKNYVFNIDFNKLQLLGFKEILCSNTQYKVYGIMFCRE